MLMKHVLMHFDACDMHSDACKMHYDAREGLYACETRSDTR